MISEGSCDTGVMMLKIPLRIIEINNILNNLKWKAVIINSRNITLDQINAEQKRLQKRQCTSSETPCMSPLC